MNVAPLYWERGTKAMKISLSGTVPGSVTPKESQSMTAPGIPRGGNLIHLIQIYIPLPLTPYPVCLRKPGGGVGKSLRHKNLYDQTPALLTLLLLEKLHFH